MLNYIIRRLLYVVPILFGVMLVTFVLFFLMQSPESMARNVLGKRANPTNVQNWLEKRGYDKPLFFNHKPGEKLLDSIFWNQMRQFATLDLGRSDTTERPISEVFKEGALPSIVITLPAFLLALAVGVVISLYLVFLRHSPIDAAGVFVCVALMSIPAMVYIIFGQGVVALLLNYFPAYGFQISGWSTLKFLLLPVALMGVIGLGRDVRLYRAIFLEEIAQDYVRTARAKGVSNARLLLTHVLKNGMIALITLTVASIPTLILGSLLLENFFGIPGLGNALFVAINTTDFATVRAFVFLGAILIQIGLIATDICYALVDPRVRFDSGTTVGTRSSWWKLLVYGPLGIFAIWALTAFAKLIHRQVSTLPLVVNVTSTLHRWWESFVQSWDWFFSQIWVQNSMIILAFGIIAYLLFRSARSDRWSRSYSRLFRDRLGVVAGMIIVVYMVVGALDFVRMPAKRGGQTVIDWLTRDIPAEKSYSAPLASTTLSATKPEPLAGRHLLGTDTLGKDTLVQTVKACRTALLIGGITSLIYIPVGTLLGILAGYYRRWVDDLIQYTYSVISSIPYIILLVAILLILGRSLTNMSIALSITTWVGLCRLLRGETFRQSERAYVSAAQALGQSQWRIITSHILPNVLHLVLIDFVLGFSGLVLAEAILSYLSVGAPVGTPSWGAMIDSARNELSREPVVWWNITAATGALFFLVLSLNLFGDALRRAFDPRQG